MKRGIQMKIGFFDSGIGGISVLYEAMKALPEEEFLYYADTAHVPYGTKTKEEIKKYVEEAISFMAAQGVKAIVVACNTATCVAIETLRKQYELPILGMEPAVKSAIALNNGNRVIVTATPMTIREEKLYNLLKRVDKRQEVDLLPLPGLVAFAERGEFSSSAVTKYLEQELSKFELEKYSALVFGCTHFRYFKDMFEHIFENPISFVDGSEGTVKNLKRILKEKKLFEYHKQSVIYYESGVMVRDKEKLEFYERLYQRLDELAQEDDGEPIENRLKRD